MKHSPRSKPFQAVALCCYFFLAPFLQIYAYFKGIEVLNYGSPSIRSFVIYGGFSPLAGYLLWTENRRARFAAYVFLTMEIIRSVRWGHPLPLFLAAVAILALQTKRVREIYPSMMERWRLRK